MRQPARPDLWEARVWQPPGPTRQVRALPKPRPSQVIPVFDRLAGWKEVTGVKKALPPILGPDDVAAVSQATLDFLRRNLGNHLPLSLPQVEQTVRFFALAKRCSAVRERRGLTIADVSKELKVPQYRLKAIESCRMAEVQPNVVEQYIGFLGLNRWFRRWASANQGTPTTVRRVSSRVKA